MNCPKCDQPLSPLVMDGVEVDTCSVCEGIWFDKAELGQLLDKTTQRVQPIMSGDDAEDANYRRQVSCPRDGGKLLRVNSARNHKVTLDACVVCQGVWLDGGEFKRIREVQPGVKLGDLV